MARRISRPKVKVTTKVTYTVKVGGRTRTVTKRRTRYC